MKKQREIWKKALENRDSVYYVSNMGRCRKVSKSTGDETITKGRLNRQIGYYSINNNYVHRLVAEQFLGPKPAWAEQVDHINADKTDNRAENLRWVTRKENNSTDHAKTMHRLNANSWTGSGQVIRAVKGEQELFFKTGREAARALGCSHVLVYNCLNRRGSARRAKGWTLTWDRKNETAKVVKAEKGCEVMFFKNGREAARALGCSHVLVYNCLNRRGSARRAKGWTLTWVPCGDFERLSVKLEAIN